MVWGIYKRFGSCAGSDCLILTVSVRPAAGMWPHAFRTARYLVYITRRIWMLIVSGMEILCLYNSAVLSVWHYGFVSRSTAGGWEIRPSAMILSGDRYGVENVNSLDFWIFPTSQNSVYFRFMYYPASPDHHVVMQVFCFYFVEKIGAAGN